MRYTGPFILLSSQGLLKKRRSSKIDNKYGDVMARAERLASKSKTAA